MKQPLNSLISLLWLLASAASISYAQPDQLHFEHLSVKQGLSNNQVTCILQDREGFLWFGTDNGLNKYDGHSFTVFKADPTDPRHSLLANDITHIHEDSKGRLWVTTYSGGLHQVDKRTGRVTAYRIDSLQVSRWDEQFSISEDRKGFLWVGTENGLARLDPSTRKFTKYLAPLGPISRAMAYLQQDDWGRLWAMDPHGVYQLDPQTGMYTRFPVVASTGDTLLVWGALHLDAAGVAWVGTLENGLFRMDTRIPSRFTTYNPGGLINQRISLGGLYEKAGYLWLATNNGLQRIDKKTNQVLTYHSEPAQPGSLGSNSVSAVYQDRTGTLWVGTNNGISQATTADNPFFTYQLVPTPAPYYRKENYVNALLEDGAGTIWVSSGTRDWRGQTANGLYRFDPLTHQAQPVGVDLPNSQEHFHCLLEDRFGRLWTGTGLPSKNVLYQIDRATGKLTAFPCQIPVRQLAQDGKGRFWIGGWTYGLACFDPVSKQFTYYPPSKDSTGLLPAMVTSVMASRSGEIWIGSYAGLSRLNPLTGRFTHYLPNAMAPKGHLNDYKVLSLYEDATGITWVGTNQGGLNRLDPRTNTFSSFTTQDGLASNHILNITADTKGNLWVATNGGLSRWNPQKMTFRNFDVSDGLPNNALSTVYNHQGRLLYGSSNGFVVFHPDSIPDRTPLLPVYITALKVQEKNRELPTKAMELPYQDNFLSLDFVALNYTTPGKEQYAYQLVGLEPDWVYSGHRRFASYTDLAPGRYEFRVRASLDGQVWNEPGARLTILIHPPWWRTWWAYSLYGFVFMASIWGIMAYRSRNLRRANRLLEEKVAKRTYQLKEANEELTQTLEHLQATQTQLIQKEKMASLGELTAGIAHEIQNPLNFVNNFAEVSSELVAELKQEEMKELPDKSLIKDLFGDLQQNLSKIHHHGQRADSIVKGMLQHSRISTGQKEPTDLNALADEYLRLSYHGLRAKDTDFNAQLTTDFDPTLGQVAVVPQEMGRVLLNLFNNAFYATQQKKHLLNSQYQPEVKISTRKVGDKLEIRVIDNGVGIPAPVRQKIFQPFFTTKPTGEGTGLGLSLSYDIVTKGHGGELRVKSEEGDGTEFIVILPIQ